MQIGLLPKLITVLYISTNAVMSDYEFGMYQYNDAASISGDGWIPISSILTFNTLLSSFVSYYNSNGGLPTISLFTSSNCCFTFSDGNRLAIDGSYLYPYASSSSQCNPSGGYTASIYSFYSQTLGSGISSLSTTGNSYSSTTDCSDNNNPGIYYRFIGPAPSNQPSVEPTIEATLAPNYYECDLSQDDLIVSWDDILGDFDNTVLNKTEIELTQSINSNSNTYEVNVKVRSKYIVGATHSGYSMFYESITNNGYLGFTYILDTNDFDDEGRLLQNGNTCENRLSSSYNNRHFLNEFWNYTLFPSNPNELGNDMYLEYGDQNIWDLQSIGDTSNTCGMIEWSKTFSFFDLWYNCKDSNNNPSYTLVIDNNNNEISLNINFYLIGVSPNPLYLTACNDGATDCGQYITKTILFHPLSIVFSKNNEVISNENDVLIDLFTTNLVSTSYKEYEHESNNTLYLFEMSLITSVPYFMALDINTAIILSPTENELINNNNGIDFISDYYIIEETDSYMTDNCLILTDYRCFQKFDVIIEVNQCPENSGLSFDGSYYLSADFNCIVSENSSVSVLCDQYSSINEALSITLDGIDLEYTEICDSTVYDITWDGSITFYTDNTYTTTQNTFSFGDTVYARASIFNDISNYTIFGMSIEQCFVCSADTNDTSLISTCLDTSGIIDTSLFYTMPSDTDLQYTSINSNISDTMEDFSFIVPILTYDTFFVDCTLELEINDVITQKETINRRRRVILQQGESGGSNGNVLQKVIGSERITNKQKTKSGGGDKNDGVEGVLKFVTNNVSYVVIGVLVLIVGILLCVVMKQKRSTALTAQESVEIAMSIVEPQKE